jgi:hypothetical protein
MKIANYYVSPKLLHSQNGINLVLFAKIVDILITIAKGKTDIEDRKNNSRGFFTIMNALDGEIMCTMPFGMIPGEKVETYYRLSQEKAERLFTWVNMHLPLPDDHTTSYQSRNESEDKYGGAIFVEYTALSIFEFRKSLILSFSGMPELIDEAMMVVLAKFLHKKWKTETISPIEAEDRNQYWQKIAEEFFNNRDVIVELTERA